MNILSRIFIGPKRHKLLDEYGWYRNLTGTHYVHPHCIDFMSRREILCLSPAELEYKLTHGSMAQPPQE